MRSQERAAEAWAEGRFDGQIVPVGRSASATRACGTRRSSVVAALRTNLPDRDAVHTAGTSSQIADGAAAVLLMTAERAETSACAHGPASSTRCWSGATRC